MSRSKINKSGRMSKSGEHREAAISEHSDTGETIINEPNELSIKMEVQIGVLAIVAGLGFFKVEELKAFINIIANLVTTELLNKTSQDLTVYLLAMCSTLSYIFYFAGLAFALYAMFKNAKMFTWAILISISAYLLMHICLVILILKGANNGKNSIPATYQQREKVEMNLHQSSYLVEYNKLMSEKPKYSPFIEL